MTSPDFSRGQPVLVPTSSRIRANPTLYNSNFQPAWTADRARNDTLKCQILSLAIQKYYLEFLTRFPLIGMVDPIPALNWP